MSKSPHPTRRALVLGGGVIALGALCALLFHGSEQAPAAPARQSQAAATTTAASHSNANRGAARGDGAGDTEEDAEESDAPESRREQYSAAFDRKMQRVRERIARDCAGNEVLVHAIDGIGEVRDRIIESAVATDKGLKTKAEQMDYERTQLQAFDTQVCRSIANESPSKQCKRHFRACDHAVL